MGQIMDRPSTAARLDVFALGATIIALEGARYRRGLGSSIHFFRACVQTQYYRAYVLPVFLYISCELVFLR